MAGENDYHNRGEEEPVTELPWHNSTRAVVGASIGGLAAIGLIVAGAMFVTRQFDKQPDAPLDYVDPTFSATATPSPGLGATPTTTETITSTSPPETTDINPTSTLPTPSETLSSSEPTAGTERDDEGDEGTTTRTDVTTTLYPPPAN